jgi:hypothetical protein
MLIQRTTREASQGHIYYIGLDVHKKISYCVKPARGQVHQERQIAATRWELDGWMKTSATLDGGDGSNDFHRLDLRSCPSACLAAEGRAHADAARGAPSPESLWKLFNPNKTSPRGLPYELAPGRCMNGHETRLPNFVLGTAKMPSNPHLRSASEELR